MYRGKGTSSQPALRHISIFIGRDICSSPSELGPPGGYDPNAQEIISTSGGNGNWL
jgi:hypothetical protein